MSSGLGIPSVDGALEASISSALDDVEARLLAAVKTDDAMLSESSRHLAQAGGKRFRPMLTLLAAGFGDLDAPKVVPAAVVVELTHVGTLYHDDVMDEAQLRRGGPSANARWGNSVAILTGDFLFACASDMLADLGPESVRIQARTFQRLVHGQLHETLGPREDEDAVAHYLSVLSDKTASLIAASTRLGALHAGVDPSQVEVLGQFGERIGMAFQLADDLLDIAGSERLSGKTPGTDLREGVATLPVLYARRAARPGDERLLALISGPVADDADHAEALELLRAHPAMDEASADVRRWADDARASLSVLPDVPARAALHALCDTVVTRMS
ncbi:polyprenyl synthetase family protein [Jiangella alkaliphila]|uniref:Heptaprenyl diphosphate synthase n=1 Tax=Jiangella alkaliphila TaxID=419479 RepID=A0A1H2FPU8_9ACTN|nr:polyprenyl synthetase family protein [Jiangella alkaliphila]SDU08988.1 heptaprenyl diphosphate synthase [Jiangella alkaliphila]